MDIAAAVYEQYALFLWAVTFVAIVLLAIWVNAVRSKTSRMLSLYEELTQGTGEGILSPLASRISKLEDASSRMASLGELVQQLESEAQVGIRRVGLVRFSPFDDTAGDQSFALALLDAEGSGVIISSLHARATTRVYARSITRGQPSHTLTVEEEEALGAALQNEEFCRRAKASMCYDRREVK